MDILKAQEELQNALIVTYLANLAFLSEYDNKLYQRIERLSQEIDSGNYKERFFLEFIKEEGEFDVYDKVNNTYLYNKKPKKFNNKAVNDVNFDSKGQFITLKQYHYLHEEYQVNNEINNAIDSFKNVMNDIRNFVLILEDKLGKVKNRRVKKIEKFIFIGTLLSRHIREIVDKTRAKHFLVCESNIELFRLSLFVFDYTLLVKNDSTVVFSIMEDPHDFASNFRMFYQNNNYLNHTLKYYSTNFNVEEYFHNIFDGIVSNDPMVFDYYRILRNVTKNSFERINNRNIICSKIKNENSILKSRPVLFIGAGPSLADNIEWIKDNQQFFIIVAMGANYSRLIDNNIRVDIISSIDPSYEIIEKLQFNDENLLRIKDQIMLLSINTHDKIESKFNKDNIFEFLIMSNLHEEAELQGGYSVGDVITTLLLQIGINELYLVGMDFALNQTTGETHASESNSATNKFDFSNIKNSLETNSYNLINDLFKVKGNLKNEVYTNRLFNMSLFTLSKTLTLDEFKEKTIFNLSQHGAFIENTIPLDKDDFINLYEPLDLSTLKDDLKNLFLSQSKQKLSFNDKLLLEEEKKYLQLIDNILTEKLEISIFSYEDFIKIYNEIFLRLIFTNIKTSFVAPVFKTYFDTIMPYIDYCFNDRDIKKEKHKIIEVRKELTLQLKRLLNEYITQLNKALI